MIVVEVAPPFGVMLLDPSGLRIPPPCGIAPGVTVIVITPPGHFRNWRRPWFVLRECGRRQRQENRRRRQQTLDSAHRCHPWILVKSFASQANILRQVTTYYMLRIATNNRLQDSHYPG